MELKKSFGSYLRGEASVEYAKISLYLLNWGIISAICLEAKVDLVENLH